MGLSVVIGLALACGIVGFAVYLGPDGLRSLTNALTGTEPSSITVAEAPVTPLPEPLATTPEIRLRVGPSFNPDTRGRVLAELTGAGHANVVVETLPFSIVQSRVGYYRDEDRQAAQTVARLVAPLIGVSDVLGIRNYGELLTDPAPGRLDLWIAG